MLNGGLYGIEENDQLSCAVNDLARGFIDKGLSIDELIVSLTQTPHFVLRQADSAPEVEATQGAAQLAAHLPLLLLGVPVLDQHAAGVARGVQPVARSINSERESQSRESLASLIRLRP